MTIQVTQIKSEYPLGTEDGESYRVYPSGKWVSRLNIDGKNVFFKRFDEYESAVKARKEQEGVWL